jgi:hypothetical protein
VHLLPRARPAGAPGAQQVRVGFRPISGEGGVQAGIKLQSRPAEAARPRGARMANGAPGAAVQRRPIRPVAGIATPPSQCVLQPQSHLLVAKSHTQK